MFTLKAPITTAADDILIFFFRENKYWQTIHMKYQDLFSLKNKKQMKMWPVTNFAWRFEG